LSTRPKVISENRGLFFKGNNHGDLNPGTAYVLKEFKYGEGMLPQDDPNNTNCHGYALGNKELRSALLSTLQAYTEKAELQGFKQVKTVPGTPVAPKKGMVIVAVYATQGGIQHSAVSVDGGPWTSKMGLQEIVQLRPTKDYKNPLTILEGMGYGKVTYFFERPVRKRDFTFYEPTFKPEQK
jgi:hypothetical protein